MNGGVIEKIDSAEAFNILRTILSLIVGSCLFIIMIFGWFILNYAKKQVDKSTRKIEKLEQYRSALLSVYLDIIVNIDMKGNIIWLNDAGKNFFGEDSIGRDISSFMTAMSRDIVKNNYYDFLFSGKKSNVTSVQWFRSNNGEKRVLSWTSCFLVDNEGNKTGVLATARDITEYRTTEKRIEKSEEYLRTIISSLIDGIVVIDRKMTITDINEYICSLLGYERDELIGDNLLKIYPDAGYGFLKKSIERHFQEGVSISGLEVNLLTKSGELIPTSIKAVLLKDPEGKVFGSLGLIRDMREVKVLQESLVQSEKLSSVGEMAAGFAHELNNPLTAIIGYSNILMEKNVSPEIEKQIRIINQQSQRCQNIISNLLMFSRRYESKKEKIDLNELVKTTINLTAYDMKSGGISIEENYGDGIPPIYVDGNKIQQVLVNLFQNSKYAVEKNDNGDKKINVTTKYDGKYFIIEVADTGIGIESQKIKRIFEPFFTTKEAGKGTGLGLSISYGIIKEHGGDIYVRSKPGKGAQFLIRLPLEIGKDVDSMESESNYEVKEVVFEKKCVLVVDDEEVIRDILDLYLTDEGHDVDQTESAVKALEMIKHKNYDIIFSDIRMPDIDGLGFLENLKKVNNSLAKKVIFITGDSMSLESFGNGNEIKNLILTKPFTMDDMKKVLHSLANPPQ